MKLYKHILIFWLLFFSTMICAQEHYPILNFTPEDYKGELQNWQIAQDKEKHLFFANNRGLLEYNGASWELYPSPNGSILRSVNIKDSLIYTGCYQEFGYWKRDGYGNLNYHSLSDTIANQFLDNEEIWNILFFDRWVLFQSLRRIYIYDTSQKDFTIITAKTNLPKIFKVKNTVYFQKMGEGLFCLQNGKAVLISNNNLFQKNIIVNIFPKNDSLLILTQEKGLFYLTETGMLTNLDFPKSDFINTLNVFSSLQLDSGDFILGTISEGIFCLSKEGKILWHIAQNKGLQNNTILSVFQDRNKNLWLGLDNGISMINISSPFLVYNDKAGKLGATYASAVFKGKLYIGTNQGLFYRKLFSSDDGFSFVRGTKGQVWCLNVLDGQLFCGHNSGTFIVKDNRVDKICDVLGTWNVQLIEGHSDLILQGNYDGLHILEKVGKRWSYRNKIQNFEISSRFVEQLDSQQIIVNHEYKGIFRLELSDDYTGAKNIIKENVPKGVKSGIAKYNNKLFYFSEDGFFRFEKEKFYFDSIYTNSILNKDTYVSGKMIVDDRSLWCFTKENIIKISPSNFEEKPSFKKIPLSVFGRKDIVNYENILNMGDEKYLLGTSRGYMQFDLSKIEEIDANISINRVSHNKLGGQKIKLPLKVANYELERESNNIHFTYSIPVYSSLYETQYQYKLNGFYDNWSNWNPKATVSFDNLPSGEYTFEVRGKVGNSYTTNSATYKFFIPKAWYLTKFVLVLYILLFIILLVLLNRWYVLTYRKREEKIKKDKERELAVMRLKSEKTIIKLRNDKLKSEVESKNRELASSAMNVVKKNELLNTIKDELKKEVSSVNIKSVLRIIDDNLDNNDWAVFQEAFNKTDTDFLKKLKEIHPELTHNDLKLCVYLRLNLSSKEIAPLLNISSRSVEIKRYRLRKKMNLERNQNLNDYILSI